MPIIDHDKYFTGPVSIAELGVSNEALDTFGAELERAYVVATKGAVKPEKAPRVMKPQSGAIRTALGLAAVRSKGSQASL